ncbi:MAG TPA: protoglobin domain-containing protein [Isosphaeraceae bacterium]|nr:protoglobin domain-containing protein [Isosphaeraceae bacterium]
MERARLTRRYLELQQYVGWTEADVRNIEAAAPILMPCLPALIDDFYDEIDRHPEARKVITGGAAQVERLKGTLVGWLRDLLGGVYDDAYVERRWRVGWRHVEIGLDQVYTNVALSRIRIGLCQALQEGWPADRASREATVRSLNRLLDLDLAIIEDAYQAEYMGRLQRAERLATLGQVAGGVAHELRNPLNVVKTSVYYLLHARNPNPEKRDEHLRRIERQVGLADGVITALSNFARMPLPDLRPVAVGPLIRDVLDLYPPGDGVRVELDLAEALPPVLSDADQMRIVFGNLIRNARDAMPAGGTLTIRGRTREGQVEVDVADTGVGIAPEDLGRIMEPLYSTKARGLGLGLAIARAILDKNQGSLRVDSDVGRGSTFTVRMTASTRDGTAP